MKQKVNYISIYEYNIVKKKTNIYFDNIDKIKINSDDIVVNVARKLYDESINIYETFFVFFLNTNNNIIGYAKISQGGLDNTIIEPILLAKYAINSLSKKIILVHNHPSGNVEPSEKDIQLTKDIKKMLSLFNIKVLDHIILSENNNFSFYNEFII